MIFFGRKCYIKREDNKVGKFDSRVDEGILVGYSSKRKAYKWYNIRLKQNSGKNQCNSRWNKCVKDVR